MTPAIVWSQLTLQKAGVRYRYYVSTPFLHGEAKTTASAGSVSRVSPLLTSKTTVARSLKEHLAAKQGRADTQRFCL